MSLGPKRRRAERAEDRLYFASYADVSVHEEMLADHVRVDSYRRAIFASAAALRGRAVLDVGAGTGVLSVFCAQAGARAVFAVEASTIAEQAARVVRQNGVQDRVQVIRGTVEGVELPEQVDVLVSEWMGYALLHESMLNSVVQARDRWLKPGGLLLPAAAELFVAPVSDLAAEERLAFWGTVKDRYGVDMSCMTDFARACVMNGDIAVQPLAAEDVLAHPCGFARLDLRTVTPEQLRRVAGSFSCRCFGSAGLNGFCVWFSVSFPAADGQPPLVLSTSPFDPETHWKQAVLYLDEPVDVVQDTRVEGSVCMFPSESSPRHVCIRLDYTIGEHKPRTKTFSIPDGLPEPQ